MSKFSWSWDSFACSFRAVAENCLLAGVAVSEKLGEVVGIVGACADVWVILVYIALNCSLVSKLSSGVVKSSKNIPGVFESWGEHASEWVDSHNLESGETWSGSHDGKFNHELGIWGDFSEESLPSSIVHSDCFAYAWLDDFLTTQRSTFIDQRKRSIEASEAKTVTPKHFLPDQVGWCFRVRCFPVKPNRKKM